MNSNDGRDLLDPASLARSLTAAATKPALQDTLGTLSASNVDAAAVRVALEVCEKTAALLRRRLADSQADADDVASAPPAIPRPVPLIAGVRFRLLMHLV